MTSRAHPLRAAALASAAAAALLLATVLAGRGSERRPACVSSLVPAYVPPDALLALATGPRVPRLLVVNPASGPGPAPLRALRRAVAAAQAAGARVLGYVPSGYGARPAADVEAEVARYRAWYGVRGIFLDEVAPGEPALPYYTGLSRGIRTGGRVLVLNPGVVPARGFFGIADVIVTFEGPAAAYRRTLADAPAWLRHVPPEQTAHLLYAASRAQALAAVRRPAAGYVYATPGTLPDPWRTVPRYLADEVGAGGCR